MNDETIVQQMRTSLNRIKRGIPASFIICFMLLIVLSLAPSRDSWPQDNKANIPKTFNSVFTKL
ncbi:MAG: hypothetical protein JSV21_11790, partial [Nitrospirota bacterium]